MDAFTKLKQARREASWPQWLREAASLQRIEGNPLSEEQLQMLEDWERRGLSKDERAEAISEWAKRKFGAVPSA